MLKLALLLLLLPQQSETLLDAVNSERGGRHWIDQTPPPSKSPEQSRDCLQIEPGSRIELVAAEPLVFDPVWIDFDHHGRMFVAEYSDYPIGPVDSDGQEISDAKPLSKIVMLEDTDHDGRMDKRTVFADHLKFCHSFMPLMNGILACAQTQMLFLQDTDGDNVADVREVWFDGFTPAHPQMQIGCPRFGMDNWIYLTYAPGNVVCKRPGFETKVAVKMPRQDMRFHPLTMKFEVVSGMGQFGNTFDNDGHRFFSTNRNPIMMEIIPEAAGKRNPYVSISPRHTDVGPSGGDTRVYPLVDMKSNWLAHAGTHTSACGVTAYRGDLWDDKFQHSVFACEPVGHLVTRSIVEAQPGSPALTARRARQKADFLASSDTWFRPSSLRTGPDGALYLADMYRMWVEHPKFLPPEIAAQIDWRAGEDLGRIWRIAPDGEKAARTYRPPVNDRGEVDPDGIVDVLKDGNGWRRQTAQRLLLENSIDGGFCSASHRSGRERRKSLVSEMNAIISSREADPQVQHHALRVLEHLDALSEAGLIACLETNAPEGGRSVDLTRTALRANLAEVIAPWTPVSSQLRSNFHQLLRDADASVAFAAMLNMPADLPPEQWSEAVSSSAARSSHWNDPWYQKAVQTVSAADPYLVAKTLVAHSRRHNELPLKQRAKLQHESLLTEMAREVAMAGDASSVSRLLSLIPSKATPTADVVAVVLGFNAGARKNGGALHYRSLEDVLKHPEELQAVDGNGVTSATDLVKQVRKRIDQIVQVAQNDDASAQQQAVGMKLLALIDRVRFISELPRLLSPEQPAGVQAVAVSIVREFRVADGFEVILKNLPSLAPSARSAAVSLFLTRVPATIDLLTAMNSGTIPSGIIDIDQRVRLLKHKDDAIKRLASKLFGGVVSSNRKAVAEEYEPALTLESSVERGAAVFEKTCSKCHRIDGKGHNVGPDISDTRRRTRDALLYDILDPNRRVDPQFSEYVVLTTDGLTFNGLLVSDSGAQIVLRQPEGKERTIERSEIEEMQATAKSLMPEGVEKDVTVQEMADLLEFLKAR